MRPLNRPMFRYGGPIKEGIMQGMQDGGLANNEGPRRAALVGNPVYPKGPDGRTGHVIPAIIGGGMAALRALPMVYRGFRSVKTLPGTRGFVEKAKSFFTPSNQAFRQGIPTITRTKDRIPGASGSYSPINIKQTQLPLLQALKDPTRVGQFIRQNPLTALTIPTLPNVALGAVKAAGPVALEAGKRYIDAILPGEQFRGGDDPKVTGGDTPIERLDKNKTVASGDTGGDPNTSAKTDAEKQKITEDRIQETKNKYYKLMGIDKMNKEAVYDSLIDASKIIQAEGGDLKGSIKSGNLQTQLIDAISKNLDKSADLKKKIDSAVLSAEIQKDINKTKMSDFDKQLAILGPEGYRKKALGETSVADMVAATKAKGTLVNSDIVSSFIEAKGGKVTDTFDDTKYQKWEKNNSGKDEIDYITENFSTIDPGVYVVNVRAVQIGIGEDGKKTANYVDLSTIIG